MYFEKITLDISFTKQARRGDLLFNYGPIHYYKVLGNPFRFDLLKCWKPTSVHWVEISGPLKALPHRDHGSITSLNCYFDSGGATTHFWEPVTSTIPLKLAGEDQANIYPINDLCLMKSFKAGDGDCYLLDTSKIHSVDKDPTVNRRFIQLTWQTIPFAEILKRVNLGS